MQENSLLSNQNDIVNIKNLYEMEKNHLKDYINTLKTEIKDLLENNKQNENNFKILISNIEQEKYRILADNGYLEAELKNYKENNNENNSKINDLLVTIKLLESNFVDKNNEIVELKRTFESER